MGYRVIAFDLPGFGQSWTYPMRPRMSALAHARTVLAAMDLMHIERAHVVGWSLGGAVALHMADLAPERVASLTLMASVSEQATEESGSYFFEHVKYAAGWGMATAVRYGVPHFGLLSHLDTIRASMRNFWDTDMRPLRGIMQRLKTPTLIIHGRHDFLVPDWAAARSHELIGPSRLVMLDASHFLPFMQVDEVTAHVTRFFERHEEQGVPALRQVADLAPEGRHLFGAAGASGEEMIRGVPWWVLMLIVAGGVVWRQRLAAVVAALCVSFGILDLGVAVAGIVVGLAGVSCTAWWRVWTKRRRGESVRNDWERDTRSFAADLGECAGVAAGDVGIGIAVCSGSARSGVRGRGVPRRGARAAVAWRGAVVVALGLVVHGAGADRGDVPGRIRWQSNLGKWDC